MAQVSAILRTALCATSVMASVAASSVSAQSLDDVAQIDVLPGWQTSSGTHMAGIRVTLAPGWKTYWRAPGDSGIPPRFSWSGSENIAGAEFHWPTPQIHNQNNIRTLGYENSLVLPIELLPQSTGEPITMSGEVTIGVCEDVCVPMRLPFSAELPLEGRRDGAITAALLSQPQTAAELGMAPAICEVAPTSKGLEVTAQLSLPAAGDIEAIVIETNNPEVWVSPTDVFQLGTTVAATVDMIHVYGGSFALDRSDVRITVLADDYAIDVQGCSAG